MGNQKQLNFLAMLGGMDDMERKIFQMDHDGQTDLYIQTELCLSREMFHKIEDSMRRKLTVAIMSCIDSKMESYKEEI